MGNWIEWKHSHPDGPLDWWIWCEILMQDGEVWGGFCGDFNWSDLGDQPGNIMAYRIPKLQDEPMKKEVDVKISS